MARKSLRWKSEYVTSLRNGSILSKSEYETGFNFGVICDWLFSSSISIRDNGKDLVGSGKLDIVWAHAIADNFDLMVEAVCD